MLVFSSKGTFDGIIYLKRYVINEIDIILLWISKFMNENLKKKPLQLSKPILVIFNFFILKIEAIHIGMQLINMGKTMIIMETFKRKDP
jgi:hypothetical protein